MMKIFQSAKHPSTKRLVGIIAFSFLITFIISRLVVYLVLGHLIPDFFLTIKGVHIHHFTYGMVILVLIGFYLLLKHPEPKSHIFQWCALIYGIGLGLTFDEFGMWVRLEDDYWIRHSYDAVIIITLLLLNVAYFEDLKKTIIKEAHRLSRIWKKYIKK